MKYLIALVITICHVLMVTGQSMVPCNNGVSQSGPVPVNNGPPLPVLPDQFQMHVEANIVQKNMTMNIKEYYDYPGNRGMLERYSRTSGERTRTIMDFKHKEAWMVFANNTCRFLTTNSSRGMFSFMSGENGTHIKTAKDLLYFGDNLGEIYVGTSQVRGIPTNHWRTCVQIPATNSTFTLDYYFTKASEYFVDGKETEIPVRAVINGTGKSMHGSTGNHSFYHVYDFFDFKSGPIDDEGVFQVPPGVVCNQGHLNTNRAKPVIPDQFSANMEKILTTPDGRLIRDNYQLHVDNPSKIFRIDSFRPLLPTEQKLYGNIPLSYIYDLNNKVIYIIDKYGENCTVVTGLPSKGPVVQPPAAVTDLFLNLTKFTYQGQKTLRGMPVESWGFYNSTNKENIDILFYMSQSPDSKPNMQGPKPDPTKPENAAMLQPVGIYKWKPGDKNMKPMSTVEHLFDFTSGHVAPEIFDVANCYALNYHSIHLAVDITGQYVSDIVKYHPKEFVSKLRQIFANTAKVSPTRISSIKWEVMKPKDSTADPFLMVTFVMLDNKLDGLDDTTLAGPSLNDALTNLQNAWNSGTSSIQFNFKLDASKTLTLGIRMGSLWQLQPQYVSDYSSSGLKRYSPGAMAGIGIGMLIVGAILGILAAYVIYKRIDTSVPYEVTN